MCKCTPEIRTPFCGRGDCLPPASRAQDMERLWTGEGSAEVFSFQQVGLYSVEVGSLWACVNCGTAVSARREELRNCRVCALMAQMQMAMPRG